MNNGLTLFFSLMMIIFFLFPMTAFAESSGLRTIVIEKNTAQPVQVITDESKLLKYAKELQIQSQIIAKNYFYISQGLRENKAGIETVRSVGVIDKSLNALLANINDSEKKNLLQYLSHIHMDSKELLNEQYSEDNASQIVDYSETVYEASQSVIDYLSEKSGVNYSLQNDILHQQLLLQRISKFYIAYQVGFNDEAMLKKLAEEVKKFEKGLEDIGSHKFKNEEQEFIYSRLEHYWTISRKFYEGMKEGELTLIVSVSTDHMVSYLNKILAMEQMGKQSIELVTSSD